jgi:FkbM family methyltransferase
MRGGGLILRTCRAVLGRRRFFGLNTFLFHVAARNIGLLNYENDTISGESHFLTRLARTWRKPVVIDVGANVGDYASALMSRCPDATCFAFEPHPKTFQTLEEASRRHHFEPINAACGETPGQLNLYDYGDAPGSQHASLHAGAMSLHGAATVASCAVEVTTLDDFVHARGLDRIDLLKIDTEGHELSVLRGARRSLSQGKIAVVHFEFNEMNVASRVFFRDFVELLKDFKLYRLMRDGLVPLEPYNVFLHELFAYQNVAAIRRERADELERVING